MGGFGTTPVRVRMIIEEIDKINIFSLAVAMLKITSKSLL